MQNHNSKKILAVVALIVTGVAPGWATLLNPGSAIPMSLEAEPVGASVVTTASVPFTSPTFAGTLVSTVWANDTANPFGGLTFTYQLFNAGPDTLDRMTLSSYAGFLTDASYFGAGIVPFNVSRSGAGNQISYNFIDANFNPTLARGANSSLLVIQTDSAGWHNSLAGVIDSSTVNVATFAPATVPEPATATLAVLGVMACLAGRRLKP